MNFVVDLTMKAVVFRSLVPGVAKIASLIRVCASNRDFFPDQSDIPRLRTVVVSARDWPLPAEDLGYVFSVLN